MPARSYLFVPGDDPDKLAKAWSRGADALIVDLEDAVAPARKREAADAVARWAATQSDGPGELWVRVNNSPDLLETELATMAPLPLAGIVVPKVESAEQMRRIAATVPGMPLMAMIETARAVLEINEIATTREVQTLIIGEYDLAAELGMFPDRNGTELLAIRSAAVVASAGAGIGPPVGAADADFSDVEAYAATTRALKRMGFFGRATIHPVQVMIVNEVFTPTADEVEAASRLVAAFDAAVDEGRGVIVGEDGTMVDEALVRGARNTLETARRSGIL